jgi:hypothetical protein
MKMKTWHSVHFQNTIEKSWKQMHNRYHTHTNTTLYLCYMYLFTYTGVQHDFHIRWWSCHLMVPRRVSHVKQELLTLPEHPKSSPVFCGVRIAHALVFHVIVLPMSLDCLFVITPSVLFVGGVVCFYINCFNTRFTVCSLTKTYNLDYS